MKGVLGFRENLGLLFNNQDIEDLRKGKTLEGFLYSEKINSKIPFKMNISNNVNFGIKINNSHTKIPNNSLINISLNKEILNNLNDSKKGIFDDFPRECIKTTLYSSNYEFFDLLDNYLSEKINNNPY